MLGTSPIRTIVKLLVLSLVVGLLMRWFNLTPLSLIENFGENVRQAFETLRGFVGWAVDYVLLGAVVVVPIWLVTVLVNRVRR